MKFIPTIMLSFLFSFQFLPAQTLLWEKALQGENNIADAHDGQLVVDPKGDLYLAGTFSDTIDFDMGPGQALMNSKGKKNIFICKMDTKGELKWKLQFGEGEENEVHDLACDTQGNIYLAGHCSNPKVIGKWENSNDDVTVFLGGLAVYKISPSGAVLWERHWDSFGDSYEELHLAIGQNDNLIIASICRNENDLDPGKEEYLVDVYKNDDPCIVTLSSEGEFISAIQYGGINDETCEGLVVDKAGNTVTMGRFEGRADFDPGRQTAQLHAGKSAGKYLLKLSPEGVFQWVKQVGDKGNQIHDLACDNLGNIVVAGNRLRIEIVDSSEYYGRKSYETTKHQDLYLAKYNTGGELLWEYQFKSGNEVYGQTLAMDSQNNAYLKAGILDICEIVTQNGMVEVGEKDKRSTVFIKMNPQGNIVWLHEENTISNYSDNEMIVDKHLHIFNAERRSRKTRRFRDPNKIVLQKLGN